MTPLWLILAASDFPRGPGFYLNLLPFALVFLSYLVWLYACWWVDDDARHLDLNQTQWNALVFGGGLLGLLLFWLIPWFLLAFPVMVALYLVPLICYVSTRNAVVPAAQKVWTERHLRLLIERYLRINMDVADEEPDRGPKVQFLRKPNDPEGEAAPRLRKVRKLRGYRRAVELLGDAVQRRATDVQMEPTGNKMAVRLRIDGVYHPAKSYSRASGEAVILALKMLAELELAERRKPQEGGFPTQVDERRVDFGIHTAGTVEGEKLSLRIQDRAMRIQNVAQLGLPEAMRQQLSKIAGQDAGLFLVSGPPGSGKTATVYACLQEMDRFQRAVATVEDPVEYRLANVDQVQLDRRVGETYGAALKRLLVRQEVDVVFVGEIRDNETADFVCAKAREELLVFSTVQAHDALTGLFRLIELGVESRQVADVLHGVLSQRLVRILCPRCKVKYRPNPEMVRKANLPADRIKHFYRPPEESERPRDAETGQVIICDNCDGRGYHGRTGIFELLVMNDRLRALLHGNASLNAVKQEAARSGMTYLQDEAIRLVIEGTTSVQEILQILK
jgi:type II secretory ATPase GspE/PulE/Tfp pilus assembly ATPase PilB-like protein